MKPREDMHLRDIEATRRAAQRRADRREAAENQRLARQARIIRGKKR